MSIVLISGPPASGKSWWGRSLSRRFRLPYLDRDHFKPFAYSLCAELGVPERGGQTSRDAWLAAVGAVLDSGLPVIADGVFNHDAHVEGFRSFVAERTESCFEIRLDAPSELLLQRYERRSDPPLTDELRPSVVAAVSRSRAAVLPGAPGMTLDTSNLETTDVESVAAVVQEWLSRH